MWHLGKEHLLRAGREKNEDRVKIICSDKRLLIKSTFLLLVKTAVVARAHETVHVIVSFRKAHLAIEDHPKSRGAGAHSWFDSTSSDLNDAMCKNDQSKCRTSQTAECMHLSCNRL